MIEQYLEDLENRIDPNTEQQLWSEWQAFLNGDPVELHQVMIKAEEAGLATDLLLEIDTGVLALDPGSGIDIGRNTLGGLPVRQVLSIALVVGVCDYYVLAVHEVP